MNSININDLEHGDKCYCAKYGFVLFSHKFINHDGWHILLAGDSNDFYGLSLMSIEEQTDWRMVTDEEWELEEKKVNIRKTTFGSQCGDCMYNESKECCSDCRTIKTNWKVSDKTIEEMLNPAKDRNSLVSDFVDSIAAIKVSPSQIWRNRRKRIKRNR